MRVLLVSTYELGHQPLHLASPAAALRARGHDVHTVDVALEQLDSSLVTWADKVAFSVPMHTAARLARHAVTTVDKPVCFYGLYAEAGRGVAEATLAGEYEPALVRWVEHGGGGATLERGRVTDTQLLPARGSLPALDRYAHLALGGEERVVGYVEASHGCAHRCRHCPVPVVYDGRVRVVPEELVLADVEQQVEAGARHITFGDPDFLNAVHHSRRVVRAVHATFPDLTFDCTVKVEHILRHDAVWGELAAAGCLFVVSAFETVDDAILTRLDKGHTAADAARALVVLREHGIEIRPSWLPFTPWTTLGGVRDILEFVAAHDLVGNVDPVQYTIRLLLPPGSLLLDDVEVDGFDAERFTYVWHAADPEVDALQARLATLVERALGQPIPETYGRIRAEAGLPQLDLGSIEGRPRLTEPWFC